MTDNNRYYVNLDNPSGGVENFSMETPKVVVGNLIIGESYTEPQGMTEVMNHTSGEKCELDFRARGWTSRNNNTIFGVVKDAQGVAKYHLTGKYTESIEVIDLKTNETFVAWTAPEKSENADMMYGFNSFTL